MPDLGIAMQAQSRMAEAEAALRRSVALVYDNPLAHFHLGQVLAARAAYAEAAATLRVARSQDPALAEAAHILTRVEQAQAATLAAAALKAADTR